MSASTTIVSAPEAPGVDFTDRVIRYADNASENSSCKDSGTGDSAKRSNEDLLPDEYTLIINGKTLIIVSHVFDIKFQTTTPLRRIHQQR